MGVAAVLVFLGYGAWRSTAAVRCCRSGACARSSAHGVRSGGAGITRASRQRVRLHWRLHDSGRVAERCRPRHVNARHAAKRVSDSRVGVARGLERQRARLRRRHVRVQSNKQIQARCVWLIRHAAGNNVRNRCSSCDQHSGTELLTVSRA